MTESIELQGSSDWLGAAVVMKGAGMTECYYMCQKAEVNL